MKIDDKSKLKIFSYGGGVQSTAALVLAAHNVIDYDTFVFANVGNDSEHPETLDYINSYAIPFVLDHGWNATYAI